MRPQQIEQSFSLSQEWANIFEQLSNTEAANKTMIVTNIHPVFVWKSAIQKHVKLRPQLAPYMFVTKVIQLTDGKYEFKLSKNHSKKFTIMIRDIKGMEGDTWNAKWQNILNGKENLIPKENKLHKEKEISLKLSNQITSIQHRFEKVHKPGSSLFPEETNRETILEQWLQNNLNRAIYTPFNQSTNKNILYTLYNLDGYSAVCFNNSRSIVCALDNSGIHFFKITAENIEEFDFTAENFRLDEPVGISSFKDNYYIPIFKKNHVKIKGKIEDIIKIPNPVSVNFPYVLSTTSFYKIGKVGIETLFDMKSPGELPTISFSDFIMYKNKLAIILNSFDGKLYGYNCSERGECIELKVNPNYKISGNPRSICQYNEDTIFIAETDNRKISIFKIMNEGPNIYLDYIDELRLDFKPTKVLSIGEQSLLFTCS